MSQSTHIGVFLKFQEGDVEIKTTVLKSPETGKEFPLHGDVKFCPTSGKELVEHVNTKMEKLQVQGYMEDDIEGLDEDTFWSPEGVSTILIPNETSEDIPFMSKGFGSYDSGGHIDLTDVDVQDTIEKFKQKYDAYIKYYEAQYGSLEVKFGAVSYWS